MSDEQVLKLTGKERACVNCTFGVFDEKSKQVLCHFLPPTPVLMQEPNPRHQLDPTQSPFRIINQALPPTLNPTWWCAQGVNKNTGETFTGIKATHIGT